MHFGDIYNQEKTSHYTPGYTVGLFLELYQQKNFLANNIIFYLHQETNTFFLAWGRNYILISIQQFEFACHGELNNCFESINPFSRGSNCSRSMKELKIYNGLRPITEQTETLTLGWYNVGPPSKTSAQHCTNLGSTSLRRRPSNVPTLGQHLVFAAKISIQIKWKELTKIFIINSN